MAAPLLFVAGLHAQEIERMPQHADSPLNRPLTELRHINVTQNDTTHGSFTAIAQSPDGFLWLGTSVGLLRFDGVRFDDTYANRLPSLSIATIYADVNGDVWVGYYVGGLSRVRGNDVINYRGGEDVPYGTLHTVLRGPDAHLWAASTRGVVRLVGDRWIKVGAELGFDGEHPRQMQMIGDVLWIVDGKRAWYLKPGATRFSAANSDDHIAEEWRKTGLPARLYNQEEDGAALVDSSGALWINVPKGIERDRWVTDQDGHQQRIVETFTGADGLSSNGVQDIFEDREGNVWVGTDVGLDQFRPTNLRRLSLPGNVLIPFVVPQAGNQVWIPSVWQSPFLMTGDVARSYPDIPNAILAATRDKHGVVWMAGVKGVFRYEGGQLRKITWPPELIDVGIQPQSIAVDGDGVLWVSVPWHGLYQFKEGAWTKISIAGLNGAAPNLLLDDELDRFWIVGPHDTLAVMAQGNTVRYGPNEGLKAGEVLALEVTKSHVWAGGEHGLFVMRGDRFVQIKGQNGEVFRGISGLVETSNGDLWINALDGAYHIEAAELIRAQSDPSHEVAFQFFGQDDGRIGMADRVRPLPTLVQGDDGRLWFSTTTAVSWISPQAIIRNTVAPNVVIDAISDGESRYLAIDGIKLLAGTRRVDIKYTAPSLANPKRVNFQYKLDGVDNDWQDAGQRRSAFYTNLGPGDYRFHVRAFNEDGVVSKDSQSLGFAIAAAWYQTAAFKALCVALILASLLALHWLRMRQDRSRFLIRMEARNDERDRIARDLHDTLLQSVQGLIMHFQSVAVRIPEGQPARIALDGALDSADKVVAEARGRVLDLRSNTCGDLRAVLEQTGVELTAGQSMRFKILIEGRPRELTTQVYWEVLSIAKEAMFNAYQHSNGTLLEVEIAYLSSALRVRLRDDGIGVLEDVLQAGRPNHWGISGMRERADKISAKFSIWSGEGEGCEIEVIVPASAAYSTQVSGFQWMLDRMRLWARSR
ncbi:sensor histidine kinase [Dyella sp. 20L07]|uniref:sensor histidine kinase n=1 Tax=Dyella sp. 20L07 TaxID=3384240 RepID=UPI003D2AB5CC